MLEPRSNFGYLPIESAQSIIYCEPLLFGLSHFRICLIKGPLIAIGDDQVTASC